jgi:hypothetical protein
MSLKFGTVQVFTPHPVVPTMQGNAVVIDYPSSINRLLEVSIPLVTVELELQCFHTAYDRMSG